MFKAPTEPPGREERGGVASFARSFARLSTELARATDLEHVADLVATAGCSLVGARSAVLSVVDAASGRLRRVGAGAMAAATGGRGLDQGSRDKGSPPAVESTLRVAAEELGDLAFSFDDAEEPPERRDACAAVAALVAQTVARLRREAFRAESTQLLSALREAPAPAFVLRGDGLVFELANPRFAELVGLREDAVGRSALDVLDGVLGPDGALGRHVAAWRRVYTTGVPEHGLSLHAPVHHDDGSVDERHFHFLVLPDRSPSGTVTGVLGIGFDVTAQVLAEKRAHEVAETFQAAQHLAVHGFAIFRAVRAEDTGRIVDFAWTYRNPVAQRLAPLSRDYRGERLLEVMPELRGSDLFDKYVSVVETGVPEEVDFYAVREGVERWFSIAVSKLHDGVTVHYRDITDRKRTERERTALAKTGDLLASSLDRDVIFEHLAKLVVPDHADWAFLDVLRGHEIERVGVAHANPADAALAARLRRRYAARPELDIGVSRVFGSLAPNVLAVTPETLRALARDDDHEDALRALGLRSCISVPLRSRGETVGALTLASQGRTYDERDVAFAQELARRTSLAIENARLFEAATAERERAEEANRLKDEFLATVSHELRTPLNAILGWASMLRARAPVPADMLARALDVIHRNAQSQAKLIEDILDVSRMITGKLRIDIEPVPLERIAELAYEVVAPSAAAKGVAVVLHPCTTPCTVTGDASRLQQIVWNLLSNAIKFTPTGGRVDVRLGRRGDRVVLTVQDNGQGIDPAFLPFVFERFRQADSSSTRAHGGLGLGLAIVRHLVELHGGQTRAESAGRGHGATFEVELPATWTRLPAPAPRSGPSARPGGPERAPGALTGVRVLVVDDEVEARELATIVLETAGAEVTSVTSAEEALALASAPGLDAVVCDIGMPTMDGYAFVRAMRAHASTRVRDLPALALTAYARSQDRELALAAGFDDYLPKPVEPSALIAAVAKVVESRA